MAPANPAAQAPIAAELLPHPVVQVALREAWIDSLADDPARRHEEGGWIYVDIATGAVATQRGQGGTQNTLDLSDPPLIPGSVVVATFHTHPNPTAEGWDGEPSGHDELSADLFGVPCIIRADDGDYTTGPDRRRGGLIGPPGFP